MKRLTNFPEGKRTVIRFIKLTLWVLSSATLITGCLLEREGGGTSPPNSNHFYTTDPVEIQSALDQGYQLDGVPIAGYVYKTNQALGATTIPLYRVYDPTWDNHFYTTDLDERNTAVSSLGFILDGVPIAAYVLKDPQPGSLPFYRLFKWGDHFYTTSVTERDTAVNQLGYAYEKIEGYLYSTGNHRNTSVLYRAYKHKP